MIEQIKVKKLNMKEQERKGKKIFANKNRKQTK